MSNTQPEHDPIETYLDELVAQFGTRSPRAMRDLLNEVETHLRDSADELIAGGCDEYEAKERAVTAMGAPNLIAINDQARLHTPIGVVARQTALSALQLGSIAAVAVGASGIVAAIIHITLGTSAVVDVAPGQVLQASDCARWLSQDPTAGNCHSAALNDWVFEVVGYRIAAGILGLVGLLAHRLVTRRRRSQTRLALPAVVTNTIATLSFLIAGLWTLGMGMDLVAIDSGHGSGQWFSAAPVALMLATFFGLRLVNELRSEQTLVN